MFGPRKEKRFRAPQPEGSSRKLGNVSINVLPTGCERKEVYKLLRGLQVDSVHSTGKGCGVNLRHPKKTQNIKRYNHTVAGSRRLEFSNLPSTNEGALPCSENQICIRVQHDISIQDIKTIFSRAGDFKIQRCVSVNDDSMEYLLTFIDSTHAQIARETGIDVRIRKNVFIRKGKVSRKTCTTSEVKTPVSALDLMPVKKQKRTRMKMSMDPEQFASLTSL